MLLKRTLWKRKVVRLMWDGKELMLPLFAVGGAMCWIGRNAAG